MSIIGIKTKIVGKGASYSSERARSMEAVNLQAKKIGVQDSASPTEESLGVNEVDSSSALKPPKHPKKGKKMQGQYYRCGQELEGHLSKDKTCPTRQSVCTKCKKVAHYARISESLLAAMIPSNRKQVK